LTERFFTAVLSLLPVDCMFQECTVLATSPETPTGPEQQQYFRTAGSSKADTITYSTDTPSESKRSK
jgi:hypothetical protein